MIWDLYLTAIAYPVIAGIALVLTLAWTVLRACEWRRRSIEVERISGFHQRPEDWR